jgi:hypothetical protein
MAVLTKAKRDKMPKKDFALSGERFPIGDPVHQRLAISGATRAEHAGNISSSTAARIKSEARAKLGIKKAAGGRIDPHNESHGHGRSLADAAETSASWPTPYA